MTHIYVYYKLYQHNELIYLITIERIIKTIVDGAHTKHKQYLVHIIVLNSVHAASTPKYTHYIVIMSCK